MSNIWLVDGPPGTGKTTFLARQALHATEKHGPSSVVACSLTRTAAREIAGRDTGIPDNNIGTLHAHCYRALNMPKLAETPEARNTWNDEHPALRLSGATTTLDELPSDTDPGQRTRGDILHALVMTRRARMQPAETWTTREQQYARLWNDFKQQTDRVDFTDLIETCLAETSRHPAAPEVMLWDEAQDFSRLELALTEHWSQTTGTTIVCGDPRQAIYSWRGADPHALDQLPTAGRRTLSQSHRVPGQVHQLAQDWIRQSHQPADYRPTDQAGHVGRLPISYRNPRALVDHIASLQDAGDTVMVLAACGYILSPLLALLRKHGIPFHNPHRPQTTAWNPMRSCRKLLAFLRPDERVWGDQARCWTWGDVKMWTEPLQAERALSRGAKAFIDSKCRRDRFGETQADIEIPLDGILNLLGTTDVYHPAVCGDIDWWTDHLRSNQRKPNEYALQVHHHRGGPALRQTPRLTVGTGHSVKGAEADHVLIFPDLSRTGMWHGWHQGGEQRAQVVRLTYVMLTRARQTVTLLKPSHPEHIPSPLERQAA